MPHFEIPDSVKAYFTEPATRAVVDSLTSKLDDPSLPDMDRNKLISLNEGVVLACQVRADFVSFMASIWENTFGVSLMQRSLTETFPENCTINEVWSERHFWSCVSSGSDLNGEYFEPTVRIDERTQEVSLNVYRYDGDVLLCFGGRLSIPDSWKRKSDENGYPKIEADTKITVKNLLASPDEDITKLRLAAGDVIDFIARRLR